MNVPLKKRHHYGINGSVSSVATNANHLTAGAQSVKLSRRAEEMDNDDDNEQKQINNILSSSSSHNMSSSASQHNPSTKCSSLDSETTSSDADSPNTSKTSSQINGHQRATIPLTEAALKQHEFRYHPMATIDRIEYWNISGDFDEFVDDFDDTTYYSKPVRSERVQKQLYTKRLSYVKEKKKPSKKEEIPPKREEKPPKKEDNPQKKQEKLPKKEEKPKLTKKPKTPVVDKMSQSKPVEQPAQPKTPINIPVKQPPKSIRASDSIGEMSLLMQIQMKRESLNKNKSPKPIDLIKSLSNDYNKSEAISSIIQCRRSYGKAVDGNAMGTGQFSKSLGVLNTSFESNGLEAMPTITTPGPSRDEFYNYLRIDTNPVSEKLSPESNTNAQETSPQNNQRRSLRVFMQQRQIDSVNRSPENAAKADGSGVKRMKKSPAKSVRNLPCSRPTLGQTTTAALAKRRRSEGFILSQRKRNADEDEDDDDDAMELNTCKSQILSRHTYNVSSYNLNRTVDWDDEPIRVTENVTCGEVDRTLISNRLADHDYTAKLSSACGSSTSLTNRTIVNGHQTTTDSSNANIVRNSFARASSTTAHTACSDVSVNEIDALDAKVMHVPKPRPRPPTPRLPPMEPIKTTAVRRRMVISHPYMMSETSRRHGNYIPMRQLAFHPRIIRRVRRKPRMQPAEPISDLNAPSTSASTAVIVHGPAVECRTTETQTDAPANDPSPVVLDHLYSIRPAPQTTAFLDTHMEGSHGPITFSPTSITHSTASSDSAVVINRTTADNNKPPMPCITTTASKSLQWYQDHANEINRAQFVNPLQPKYGAIHAILSHSIAANQNDCVIVVQESLISFWFSPAKVLGIFGITRTWLPIGQIGRCSYNDEEVESMYQHRLIDVGAQFPVLVELRSREDRTDPLRQCVLTFLHLNVYSMKQIDDQPLRLCMDSLQLDTLKGFTDTVSYIALKKTPAILVTWTELNVNNLSRCGIVKYTLKSPLWDVIDDIVDYPYIQKDIRSMIEIEDDLIVGCGERAISVFNHLTGDLHVHFEIDVPTIGRNIACYTCDVEDPEFMLLLQLCIGSPESGCDRQIRVMAVQTVHPYNWRTIQTHNIPNNYGKIQSIFNYGHDMMVITFFGTDGASEGNMLMLNITVPHLIYTRNICWTEQMKNMPTTSAVSRNGRRKTITQERLVRPFVAQCFALANGQMLELNSQHITTKAFSEYFIMDKS